MLDRRLCSKAFRAILENIAYFLVVDCIHKMNGNTKYMFYECKHSTHIFSAFCFGSGRNPYYKLKPLAVVCNS